MKRTVSIILLLAIMTFLTACGGEEGIKIPDVFGVEYSSAREILEGEGFEVKAVETSVRPISEKLDWPLKEVEKGTVFKIDDYIVDGYGDLVKGTDDYYEGELISEDKSIVIYYAKEDYINVEGEETEKDDNELTSSENTVDSELPKEETQKDETAKNNEIDPDFKSAMDSYEKFMNDYVDFMKKYKANPSDLGLLSEYADFMSDYADYVEDFSDWEDEDLNDAELAYYIDVQTRVNKKLLEVAQ